MLWSPVLKCPRVVKVKSLMFKLSLIFIKYIDLKNTSYQNYILEHFRIDYFIEKLTTHISMFIIISRLFINIKIKKSGTFLF